MRSNLIFAVSKFPPADCTLASETETLAKALLISALETSKLPSAASKAAFASSIFKSKSRLSMVNKVSPFFTRSLSLMYTLST